MKFTNPFRPPPAPPGFAQGKELPMNQVSYLSQILFNWITPFMSVGFSRPLQQDDFWRLPDNLLTKNLATNFEANFYSRCPPEQRPKFFHSPSSPNADFDTSKGGETDPGYLEKGKAAGSDDSMKYDSSVLKALHRTFFSQWWWTGVLLLFGETLKTTTPLLTRVILTWLSESYIYYTLRNRGGEEAIAGLGVPQGVGYGIGLAFALFIMREGASFLVAHSQYLGQTLGLYIRSTIIGNIVRKSLRISGRARLEHNVGQITTMVSSDASRLDEVTMHAHQIWIAPIQIIIGIGLLIAYLGYSALVGLGVLIIGFPGQFIFVKVMIDQYKKGVTYTDARVRLTTEMLAGIRMLKIYGWVDFYMHRVATLRETELATIWVGSLARSGLFMTVYLIPVVASMLSFITYSLSGHELNVVVIFTSLQFFNVIQIPLLMLPAILAQVADVTVALERISKFLTAEEMDEPYSINDADDGVALDVDGDFEWESTPAASERLEVSGEHAKATAEKASESKAASKKPSEKSPPTAEESEKAPEEPPFALKDLKLRIKKGAFVGIVGGIGSGKSSILQALIGEMRRTRGQVIFGGEVAYVPQSAWIKNATLQDNILFGREKDDERFDEVIQACSLRHDLDMLPDGQHTEIGEKGINLSGGQKARISLARAAYSDASVILLDDPLAAVDAYVGKAILDQCLVTGPLSHRTRILVTHALHVLDQTDYVYLIDKGVVAAEGTFEQLMKQSTEFARLMDEYGHSEKEITQVKETVNVNKEVASVALKDPAATPHMQAEERQVGTVSSAVYAAYLRYAGGLIWIPALVIVVATAQAAQVGTTLFLGFWTSQSIDGFGQGQYMGVYSGLGVVQALLAGLNNVMFTLAGIAAGRKLYVAAAKSVMNSPVSFFDTTPLGRITSRFSKDQNELDGLLPFLFAQLAMTASGIVGTIGLVFYTFPYLGIIFLPLGFLYYGVSAYYQRTSLECKRLDSIMRSGLYSSFGETMTGLATIRAYRMQDQATIDASHGLDMENRAYFMTQAIQRWLLLRLDFFGNLLLLGIALFAAGTSKGQIDPSKVGVVLTYTLSITSVLSDIVWMYAMVEQSMNSVERIITYTALTPEGDSHPVSDEQPPASWPAKGAISFRDVQLRYREGLPLVLQGASFEIHPGEKVGIVGRTGAGKSSLIQALFRTVELSSGSIIIDDVDISQISLGLLRKQLALVPQDTTLFGGTLRENLDPMSTRTDAELMEALRRAWLVSESTEEAGKFNLDTVVSDEGSNFSAGEKQLLALCRALVKNSKIIVLDEATSSVDQDTDTKLQKTIQSEFSGSTLLCIAHRLNTIAYYDRILVLDRGTIAEFDTVLNLYDNSASIFRSLCNEARLTRNDIVRIRNDASALQS